MSKTFASSDSFVAASHKTSRRVVFASRTRLLL